MRLVFIESALLLFLQNFLVNTNDSTVLSVLICTVHWTVRYYHVTYAFHSESTLYSCLNVKELIAQNRRNILSLSKSNGIRTHNHLVRKRTLNHLAKLAKRICCVVSTYLYSTFGCMLLSCHLCISE